MAKRKTFDFEEIYNSLDVGLVESLPRELN